MVTSQGLFLVYFCPYEAGTCHLQWCLSHKAPAGFPLVTPCCLWRPDCWSHTCRDTHSENVDKAMGPPRLTRWAGVPVAEAAPLLCPPFPVMEAPNLAVLITCQIMAMMSSFPCSE